MSVSWPLKPLGELFEFTNGATFRKADWKETGLPIIRIQNLNNPDALFNYYQGEYKEKILIRNGDLLFSWSGTVGTSFGPHIWAGENGLLNQHIFKVEHSTEINRKYAYYALLEITAEIERSVVGSVGLVHVRKKDLVNFKISVPPLNEQQRIVSTLDEVFNNIADSINNVQTMSDSVKELIETTLTKVFHEDSLEWEKIPFEQSIVKVKATPKIKKREFKETGPYPIISQERDYINGYWNKSDDLLTIQTPVVVFGDHTKTLKYIDFDFVRGADGLKVLQPIGSILPKFFYHQLRSVKLETLGYARHYRLLKQIEIRVPSMEHQHQIASMFDDLAVQTSHMNGLYERKLQFLEELKQSILQEAFNGNL